ncbi:hypothetical protein [Nakamurella sp.]|uniref:hypothetical protein n=1 Tax=Nakamurella sp. TaxID=1869182 RepID=UPI0037845DA7
MTEALDVRRVRIGFCGEWYDADPAAEFVIGREGDLAVDDNPYLHRRFLVLTWQQDMWWLVNAGTQLSATISDPAGALQAWLAPGGRVPLVFPDTTVLFTAGPTTYEIEIVCEDPTFTPSQLEPSSGIGATTIGPVTLTPSQKQLIVALAEPLLRREGTSISAIPSSKEAAARLGWELTRFNRKLDNVCDKFDRRGVRGLRGGPGQLASNRRARLVEHAVTARVVTADDLSLLDGVDAARSGIDRAGSARSTADGTPA